MSTVDGDDVVVDVGEFDSDSDFGDPLVPDFGASKFRPQLSNVQLLASDIWNIDGHGFKI